MEKALREAKRNTSWVDQNPDWERGVLAFCRAAVLVTSRSGPTSSGSSAPLRRSATGPRAACCVEADRARDARHLSRATSSRSAPSSTPTTAGRSTGSGTGRCSRGCMGGSAARCPDAEAVADDAVLALRTRRPEAFGGTYEPLEAGERRVAFTRGDEVLVAVATRPEPATTSSSGARGRWRDVLHGGERSLSVRATRRTGRRARDRRAR